MIPNEIEEARIRLLDPFLVLLVVGLLLNLPLKQNYVPSLELPLLLQVCRLGANCTTLRAGIDSSGP